MRLVERVIDGDLPRPRQNPARERSPRAVRGGERIRASPWSSSEGGPGVRRPPAMSSDGRPGGHKSVAGGLRPGETRDEPVLPHAEHLLRRTLGHHLPPSSMRQRRSPSSRASRRLWVTTMQGGMPALRIRSRSSLRIAACARISTAASGSSRR
ncbi:hypothetical protein, partial [Methanoculleus chikugoensis]|uniref:hypothetical protein n=1 Tax=Methanoculleus chikugoensis TaxID=118126 RepID=UPI001FB30B22